MKGFSGLAWLLGQWLLRALVRGEEAGGVRAWMARPLLARFDPAKRRRLKGEQDP